MLSLPATHRWRNPKCGQAPVRSWASTVSGRLVSSASSFFWCGTAAVKEPPCASVSHRAARFSRDVGVASETGGQVRNSCSCPRGRPGTSFTASHPARELQGSRSLWAYL
ncbi:hypothetical protein CGC20_33020 [Leishmania donovani]|uniref:Uncharacterized protein n=1 Tax=Leishmania donovani TaxID=5661 RepID=A0A504XJ49_LEIDO|nr:hypothetical protein CGC20_33020 [Leishmania donovani]